MLVHAYSDAVRAFFNAKSNLKLDLYVPELTSQIENDLRSRGQSNKIEAIPKLIFLNIAGYDTSWADFYVLEVMSLDNFSAKRACFLAASVMWNQFSEVALMATNRIQKDLTSSNKYFVSFALSSLPYFLSPPLSQSIAPDIISLISSTTPVLRQKAITTFLHICTHYPEALVHGFPALKAALDDQTPSVVYSTLTVIGELCSLNPKPFSILIPKLYSVLTSQISPFISIRALQILRQLTTVEPRLAKKLVDPCRTFLSSSSISLLYEDIKTIVEIPITSLLYEASSQVTAYLSDSNSRLLFLAIFVKLMKLQPKLIPQNKGTIAECLNSDDEQTRIAAVDLYSTLATPKNIDSVVSGLVDCVKLASSLVSRKRIASRLVEICSKDDWAIITDFNWYISVLIDLVDDLRTESSIVTNQLIDLCQRVPSTQAFLVGEMEKLLGSSAHLKDDNLLLAASYIIGSCGNDETSVESLLQPIVVSCSERVQVSLLSSAFQVYLRSNGALQEILEFKLPLFAQSEFFEVQDRASAFTELMKIMKEKPDVMTELYKSMNTESDDEIVPPKELDDPITLFDNVEEVVEQVKVEKAEHKHREKSKKASRAQIIGSNTFMDVSATEFRCSKSKPTLLEIVIKLTCLTPQPIEAVDFEVKGGAKPAEVKPFLDTISQGESKTHNIVVEVENYDSPQIAKVIIIPRSSVDSIEGRVAIFPSFFLMKSEPNEMNGAVKEETKLNVAAKAPQIFQSLSNVFRGTPVKGNKMFSVYSRTTKGDEVACAIAGDGSGGLVLSVSSPNGAICKSLLKEAEAAIKGINQS